MARIRHAITRRSALVTAILVALFVASAVRVTYAMSCGCSGAACGGCSISYTGCTWCSTDCGNCMVFGTEDCTIGWQCPD